MSDNAYEHRIVELEAQVQELLKWKEAMRSVVFGRLSDLEDRIEGAQTTPQVAQPETDENGHVLIADEDSRFKARKAALGVGKFNTGQGYIVTCDEASCAAAGHMELVSSGEASKFNRERVVKELAAQDRDLVRFAVESLTTPISDGHRVSSDGSKSYLLPSGRNISMLKAVAWASGHMPSPPSSVKRTCSYDGCLEPSHLSYK